MTGLSPLKGVDASFGEHGGRLTYGSYLRLPQLLNAQQPASDPPAHDELLFITVHQVYELWFQQLLHEATAARDAMYAGDLWWAQHLMRRMHAIERVLIAQLDVLETMTPQDFLEFRRHLAPASGFQSVQFRELEFISGAKDKAFVERFRGLTDPEVESLAARLDEPTLWDAFVRVLGDAGFAVDGEDALRASLQSLAREHRRVCDLWELAECLIEHDELAAGWRSRHVAMVERMIGAKTGTGGSSGVDYLRTRLDLRYYPLLWDLRSDL